MTSPLHYFLVAGEIAFVDPEGNTGIARMNTVLGHTSPNIPVRLMGKANQALSMQLIKDIDNAEINILKIVILNVSPMGIMTEEEFYRDIDREKGTMMH